MEPTSWGPKIALYPPTWERKEQPPSGFWRPLVETLGDLAQHCAPLDPERPAPILLLYRTPTEKAAELAEQYRDHPLLCAALRVPRKGGCPRLPYFRVPEQALLLRHHLAALLDRTALQERLSHWEEPGIQGWGGIFLPSLNKKHAAWLLTREALRRTEGELGPAARLLGISRQALSQYLLRQEPQRLLENLEQKERSTARAGRSLQERDMRSSK